MKALRKLINLGPHVHWRDGRQRRSGQSQKVPCGSWNSWSDSSAHEVRNYEYSPAIHMWFTVLLFSVAVIWRKTRFVCSCWTKLTSSWRTAFVRTSTGSSTSFQNQNRQKQTTLFLFSRLDIAVLTFTGDSIVGNLSWRAWAACLQVHVQSSTRSPEPEVSSPGRGQPVCHPVPVPPSTPCRGRSQVQDPAPDLEQHHLLPMLDLQQLRHPSGEHLREAGGKRLARFILGRHHASTR